MSLPVVLTLDAEAEFNDAVDWYEEHLGTGADFIARVRAVLRRIGQAPEMHRVIEGDVRRTLVDRSPYAVLYRAKADRVEVIAIFHGSRDPGEWRRRV
jgi:toxin ParE1/3/4